MQKTLLTLLSGAAIGAGTTLTLPDGSTATTEAPTAADIYQNETVSVLKLVKSEDGKAARYVIEKTASIEGVAPLTINGFKDGVDETWQAVAIAAQAACEQDPLCEWSSMDSARSAGDALSAQITGGGTVSIDQDVPELDALKASLLEEN